MLKKFIQLATHTVRERHNPHLESESATAKHTKLTRQYFILSLLVYCINSNHSSLLHTILAYVVEVCSGSRLLLKILNRLACVSSADSHDRFVTERAEDNRKLQIWDQLPADVFTIASIDNFDILQSHAAVYYGNQERSYHGTTVQLVQPSSSMKLHVSSDATDCSHTGNSFPCQTPSLQSDNSPEVDHSQSPSTTVTTYLIADVESHCSNQSIHTHPTALVEAQLDLLQDQSVGLYNMDSYQFSVHNTTSNSITSESSNHASIATMSFSTEAAVLTDLSNIQPVATEGPAPRSIVIGRTRHRHSPASSPHKLGKRGPNVDGQFQPESWQLSRATNTLQKQADHR